ncbi:Hypp3041 [Branchiostoma lanceolatum]|uniref:Hypp3041 protein n=1 Tax=Branchiostoma lanceolatum TaxID=7740 RepID=A0A8J9ZZ70_BRALA|nr:Hypp3041 [Branchiostoma lanceolatum]
MKVLCLTCISDMKVAMVGTIWWLLACLVFTTASPDLQQRLQDLDTFVQNLMKCQSRPVVGLTVSVVKDGQTIFSKGYGQRDLQTGQAVDNRTLFCVGSISKSFTSALLASILAEREDVSWDTVLTDILGPSFRFRDQFRTKEATLRDLLAHKTGLENLVFAVRMGQNIDRAELGRVLDLHLPAGGVVSNALDMARYMKFHLSGGRDAAGRAVVSEGTLRQTHTADFLMPDGFTMDKVEPDWPVEVAMTQGYGMGWWIGTYRGYRRVQHSGSVEGFSSLLSLFPGVSGGVFTSANGPSSPEVNRDVHQVIHSQVGDILIGKHHWLNATTACTYPEPWWTRPEPNSTVLPEISYNFPRDKRDYEGVYGNYAGGNVTISLNKTDDKLYFSLGLIGRGLVLPTESADCILLRCQGPLAYFPYIVTDVEEKDGKIFSFSLQISPPEPPIVFEQGLKLTDPDPTEPKWGDCTGVSGSPRGATWNNVIMILLFFASISYLI